MALVQYPTSLPGPDEPPVVAPRERRLIYEQGNAGLREYREFGREYLAQEQVVLTFTETQAATFRNWWENSLVNGGAWFRASWPSMHLYFGELRRKFIRPPRWAFIGGGAWRVAAELWVSSTPVSSSNFISTNSGEGVSPALLDSPEPGDGIILLVVVRGTVTSPPPYMTLGGSGLNSSGGLRLYVYTRIADGSGNDFDMGFATDSPNTVLWSTLSFRYLNDSVFPSVSPNLSFSLEAGGLNPGSVIHADGATSLLSITAAYIQVSNPGSATLEGVPDGYVEYGSGNFVFDISGTNFNVFFQSAYKTLLTGPTENPPAFDDGSGSYGGGGQGVMTLLIGYTAPPPPPPPSPSPPPPPAPGPPPPPSDPGTKPFLIALNYTQDYGSSNINLHALYDLSIRSFTTNQSNVNGTAWMDSVQAIDSDHILANYVILNEVADPVSSGEDHYILWQRVNAQDAWVYSEPTHTKVQWTAIYDKYEVNPTSAVPSFNGKTYVQFKADDFDFAERIDNIPECTVVFIDNFRDRPLVSSADYNRNGVNESAATAAPAWRAGHIAYIAALKANRPGLKIIGNVNHDMSNYGSGVLDWAYHEGMIGRSYGTYTANGGGHTGVLATRTRLLTAASYCSEGSILHCYAEEANYKLARFGYAMAAMFDAAFSLTDSTPTSHSWHLDETYVVTGARVDDVPSGPTSNDIWTCRFENALFLLNPTVNTKTINVTGIGSGLWKRINAAIYDSQDLTLNNGANVTSVSLVGNSALLLIPQ